MLVSLGNKRVNRSASLVKLVCLYYLFSVGGGYFEMGWGVGGLILTVLQTYFGSF